MVYDRSNTSIYGFCRRKESEVGGGRRRGQCHQNRHLVLQSFRERWVRLVMKV